MANTLAYYDTEKVTAVLYRPPGVNVLKRFVLRHRHSGQEARMCRESLMKGKDQYRWPPCTNWFISAALNNEKIFFLIHKNKTSYLNKSTVLNLLFQLELPNLSSISHLA